MATRWCERHTELGEGSGTLTAGEAERPTLEFLLVLYPLCKACFSLRVWVLGHGGKH